MKSFAGRDVNDFVIARFVFLKLLALCALIAFASLLVQVDGLYASDGILPIADLVRSAREQLGAGVGALLRFPSLFQFGASDVQLQLACWIGIGAAALLLLGFSTIPCLAIAWALYLSFVVAGRDFLGFQWDALLLETLALALLIAPGRMRPSRCADVAVSKIGLAPLWLLVFHLMFASGIVKYCSADETWKHLAALDFHFETQPLPTVAGWWVHQFPSWVHALACGATLLIEIVMPFAIFLPRRARHCAALAFIGLMLLIAATGNYTFFNLLTIALATLLLDDGAWPRWLRSRFAATHRFAPSRVRIALLPFAALSIAMSVSLSVGAFQKRVPWPGFMLPLERVLGPFGLASRYGLFEDMTEQRLEIIIEGSADGVEWKTYEFAWKPGELARAPGFVAPHQPRLDWQMWFAALSAGSGIDRWFADFAKRLLEGAPAVQRLLGRDPFDGKAPRYLRATSYRYRFTTREERAKTGDWWSRERLGEVLPVLELRDGRLRESVR